MQPAWRPLLQTSLLLDDPKRGQLAKAAIYNWETLVHAEALGAYCLTALWGCKPSVMCHINEWMKEKILGTSEGDNANVGASSSHAMTSLSG